MSFKTVVRFIQYDTSNSSVLESLFVEICIPNNKNIIIGAIYRPPTGNPEEFLDKFNELLSGVTRANKHCYVTGDFNLDLMKHETHSITAQFLEALYSYGLIPMITKPTRVTAHSATHIFANNTDVPSKNGLIISDLSYMQCMIYSLASILGYLTAAWPFRIIKGKALNSFRKPWITKGLLKSINKKNKLYKNYICNRSNPQLVKYKTYKNKLILLLRTAKKRYYEMQLDKSKENIKQTWRILNNVINRNKRKASSTLQLHDNGRDISNPEIIANKFCQYFTKIGPNLASKISPPSKSFREFVNSSSPELMTKFAPVNLEELFSITNSFKDGKAPGADDIPISVIKKSIDVISDPLLSLINLSLSSGTFPDKLKIAKITPILKTGDACLVQNYRPISVLPAFSKIFERVVYNRIFKFITDNKILCSNQYGFRPGHSTSHALISFVNKVANTVDSNNYLAGVFLDLSKAFDTLDHAILLQNLEIYGVTEVAHKWITDYFTNRKQFVLVNESKSCLHNQICGVPQGSILGPLFFNLYINDLPNCSNTLCSILFADDTSLFIEHKDPNILINQLNCESQNVSDWLRANKLSINVSKTKLIIFRPRQRSLPNISPLITDNNVVELVESTKFLGVYIDQHLTWKTHINVISKKIAKSIGLIYKANFYLHQNSLLL